MVFPKNDFCRATPESQGVKSSAISAALEAIRASGKDIHSMLVLKNGYLISETYFAPYNENTKHSMFSCSKTFTSMLIGIAQGKGLLKLSDKVASFFPDKLPEEPSENLLNMTIRDLLHMATGNDQDTYGYMTRSGEDWVKMFLARPVEHVPGTFFRYNTGATYMLSAILTKLTGKTALELANEWMFDEIGIRFAKWDASPQGISQGGTGLHLTPRQMARFGLLLLNNGNWNGKQLIPEEYVREAQEKKIDTNNHIDHPDWCSGYCYQMWRCSYGAYRADGMGGQFIVMLPDANAVVVFTSALGSDIVFPMDVTHEYLAGALRGAEVLPENEGEQAKLAALSKEFALPGGGEIPAEAMANVPWGKKIALSEKLLGVADSITLYGGRFVLGTRFGAMDFAFKWGAPVLAERGIPLFGRRRGGKVSCMAKWEDGALVLRVNVLEEPATAYVSLRFEDGKAKIEVTSTAFIPAQTLEGTIA